ncbi:AAA family ATPase [Amycolatopsis suaedae]|uniref:Chromosome segregation protein SMC n=1 Tax=Amycolatopsis suaedae TaxID=2510978 RepID=A0A4Q7JD07_9PSEU|nr:AAA family ATPase [Amycolatopsis suaedae]RZQ64946.1 chromosome segregation protein SMC [Amycolatopsis suaedae]
MAHKPLTEIQIEGFTSIRSARVRLGQLNVLVGANGSGKSNFIQAFGLLGRIVDEELGLFVGLNGGASALLNDTAARIKLDLHAESNAYEAVLVAAANDELIFEQEVVYYQGEGHPRPWNLVVGKGNRETRLHEEAERQPGRVAAHVLELLRGCRVYHFHDTSADAPVKQLVPTADNISLRYDAGNLAAVLLALQESDRAAYRRIVGAIQLVAPFFRDFVLRPETGDRLRLRWQQQGSDTIFSANQMSDGTLRFVCLATLLLQPQLPALVVLDEPELGLHPFAIVQLAGLLKQAAVRSQVLIATQSVTLMNQFAIDDLIVVERVDGVSTFDRPDPDRFRNWLDEYSLGELWEKNLIGGRPGEGSSS